MFNVTVIKLGDIIKYLIILVIMIMAIVVIKIYLFDNIKKNENNIIVSKIDLKRLVNAELPMLEKTEKEELIDENKENADIDFFTSLIDLELGVVRFKEKDINLEIGNKEIPDSNERLEENEKEVSNIQLEKAPITGITTEVVTENPIADKSTDNVNGVKIKNETDFELTRDIVDISNLEINTSNVVIFHTHTCESYTTSEQYSYTATGNYRTTDLNYTVVRVGDELTNYLNMYGFNVTHDKTYHDYPQYSGSYTRSLATVTNILKSNPADIIIDLHRDAIGSNSSYAPTVKIGDDYCAQLMFVMGTNGGGLQHDNWKYNMQFAIKIQEKANELYPGLFKTMILRNSRYNQHLGKAACIIEVGATGNTMEQCLNSMKYFAEVMNSGLNII